MRFDIISCQPDLLDSPFSHSIVKRAQQKGLVDIHIHDLRKYAINKHGQIDDYAFGGGAGMVMMIEPIDKVVTELEAGREYAPAADPGYESLRDHRDQHGAQLHAHLGVVSRGEHVDDPVDGLRCRVGVQRREHEVSG